jgi:hypothetical protein
MQMAYQQNFAEAARRHWTAAKELHVITNSGTQPGCNAVAGYLFGLAGELALKEMMRRSGMKSSSDRDADPFYAHFPGLKTRLRDSASGHLAGQLRRYADSTNLFQHWHIKMRYAPTQNIMMHWIAIWRKNAEDLMNQMDSL